MGIMENLRYRISNGAKLDELVGEGFKKSSVYAANQSINSKVRPRTSSGSSTTGNPKVKDANKHFRESLAKEVALDSEIQALQLELAKTTLNNEITDAKGYSRRLRMVEERHDRLEEWVVTSIASIAEYGFGSNPNMLERWKEVELNHLKNGGPHWISDGLTQAEESQENIDDSIDWLSRPEECYPDLEPIEVTIEDQDNDSVRVWHEKNLASMKHEGVPWKIKGLND